MLRQWLVENLLTWRASDHVKVDRLLDATHGFVFWHVDPALHGSAIQLVELHDWHRLLFPVERKILENIKNHRKYGISIFYGFLPVFLIVSGNSVKYQNSNEIPRTSRGFSRQGRNKTNFLSAPSWHLFISCLVEAWLRVIQTLNKTGLLKERLQDAGL